MKIWYSRILLIIMTMEILLPQKIFSNQTIPAGPLEPQSYQLSSRKYITDNMGNILMYVNIWGHVNNPGSHLVFDGIDMATLLSVVGGPRQGAKLNSVKLYRETPDENGKIAFEIDLEEFFNSGDRSNFVEIKPNDTIVFPQTRTSVILSNVSTLNTVMSIMNLYFTIKYRN
jgi:hypothetical protein